MGELGFYILKSNLNSDFMYRQGIRSFVESLEGFA